MAAEAFLVILILVLALAWANGANDVAKGIATLVGSGSADAKRAVIWATFWTVMGGLAAALWGGGKPAHPRPKRGERYRNACGQRLG